MVTDSLLFDFDPRDIIRPLVAVICGFVLGINRERRGRAAGLRTQVLVSLGACVFALSALHLYEQYDEADLDPIRIVAGIAGGIGFLGAGSIVKSSGDLKGVTTAATVWISGGTGLACGLGLYLLAAVSVLLCVAALSGLRPLSHHLSDEEEAA
ncbi:MAG: MgtC/SapB family protein [Pirellulaceae bacterium]